MKYIYEVNLEIDKQVFEDNRAWLIEHFHDMVTVNEFDRLDLFLFENTDPINDDHMRVQKVTAQYHIGDWKTLEIYLDKQSTQMRSQVFEKLQGHYHISRRVLKHIETFSA